MHVFKKFMWCMAFACCVFRVKIVSLIVSGLLGVVDCGETGWSEPLGCGVVMGVACLGSLLLGDGVGSESFEVDALLG